jgi:protein-L-isoaspartate(D-aspartate) O-methyltransferase
LAQAALVEGIVDWRVIEALRTVRREQFVLPDCRNEAYVDRPLPIGCRQVTTQPSLVGRMVEALQLDGPERVLEVGTGLGYQAAVLSYLCREVFTIECFAELAEQARRNLSAAAIPNVVVVHGDGSLGLPEHAPFDAVIVAAAAVTVPAALVEQLAEGGRLVQPMGPGGAELVTAFRKQGGRLIEPEIVTGAYFVPLLCGEDQRRSAG